MTKATAINQTRIARRAIASAGDSTRNRPQSAWSATFLLQPNVSIYLALRRTPTAKLDTIRAHEVCTSRVICSQMAFKELTRS